MGNLDQIRILKTLDELHKRAEGEDPLFGILRVSADSPLIDLDRSLLANRIPDFLNSSSSRGRRNADLVQGLIDPLQEMGFKQNDRWNIQGQVGDDPLLFPGPYLLKTRGKHLAEQVRQFGASECPKKIGRDNQPSLSDEIILSSALTFRELLSEKSTTG